MIIGLRRLSRSALSAGLVVATLTVPLAACGEPAPRVSSQGTCGISSPQPRPSFPPGPPTITVQGNSAHPLWRGAPWGGLVVAGDTLFGVDYTPKPTVRALTLASGTELWSATPGTSHDPFVGNLLPGEKVLVVETGRCIPSPAAPIVMTGVQILDLQTGAELWHRAVAGNFQAPPIAATPDGVIIGGPDGKVTAYSPLTGEVLWSNNRPAGCRPMKSLFMDSPITLAADGGQLVASFSCEPHIIVERLSTSTGQAAWQWVGPSPSQGNGASFPVVGTAQQGNIALLSGGVFPSAKSYAKSLPDPYSWPAQLGPALDGELIVALDAKTGQPRWTELGGQLQRFVLTDGALCESVRIGLECRDDITGVPTRPVVLSGDNGGAAPPYVGDGYAAIAGGLIALAVRHSDPAHMMVLVTPVRRNTTLSLIDIGGVGKSYGFSKYDGVVVAGGLLPGNDLLILVRRFDLPEFPVDALSIAHATG